MRKSIACLVMKVIGLICVTGFFNGAIAQSPELVIQTGHTSGILSVAFSPDQKLLATSSADNTIKLWDVASESQIRSLQGFALSLAFSPDGKLLAAASGRTVQLWDVASGVVVRSMPSAGFSIALSPNGKLLAAADGKNIKLWNTETGVLSASLEGHTERVISLSFGSDGSFLVSGSEDKTVRVWNVASRSQTRLFEHSSAVMGVALSPDRKLLAAVTSKMIYLWDLSTATELKQLESATAWFNAIAFSPDSRLLAAASLVKKASGGIRLWDVATGVHTDLVSDSPDMLATIAWSPDGKLLAGGSLMGSVQGWEVSTKSVVKMFGRQSGAISKIALNRNGTLLASSSMGQEIRLWDMAAGGQFRSLDYSSGDSPSPDLMNKGEAMLKTFLGMFGIGVTKLLKPMTFSPDGKLLATSRLIAQSLATPIELWDAESGKHIKSLRGDDELIAIAFSPDSKLLATGNMKNRITVWDVATEKKLWSLQSKKEIITSLAFSPDGKLLASSTMDNTIDLWDVANGTCLRSIEDYSGLPITIAFSPNGKFLASGTAATLFSGAEANTIKLWDVSSGAKLKTFEGHSGTVNSVAFNSDGRLLVSGSSDKTIRLWDITTGSTIRTFAGHSDNVIEVVFSADERLLISSSDDATIKVWSINAPAPLATLSSLGTNNWLVATPDNLFDGSALAWRRSIWRFSHNTFDYAPVEAFFSEFYHPGLLTEIMSGGTVKASRNISEKDIRQPEVRIERTDRQADSASNDMLRTATVEVEVTEAPADAKKNLPSGGVRDVRLFRNGSLVKVWRGNALALNNDTSCRKPMFGQVICTAAVPIVAGENRFTAYAFNRDNVKSRDGELLIMGAENLKRLGVLYVLAVGINRYASSDFNLRYAVADARDFGRELKKQQDKLKFFAATEVITLTDREATKANILGALSRFAQGERARLPATAPRSLQQVKQSRPEDAVIIYFAGHGTTDKDRFYLIPHDLGVINQVSAPDERSLRGLYAHSISDRELESALERIDSAQLLMIIDACYSGQALEAEEKRRGPMNSTGLGQLAYEKGMYILTAAQSYQAALEVSRFGHGLLTYSLLEGLTESRADADLNKEIWEREWIDYAMNRVPELQVEEMKQRGGEIVFFNDYKKTLDAKTQNAQRPRVFYRREPSLHPLVISHQ
jgi:WD40 repeat protein/uncharacterized caspase-like protein